MWSFAEEMASSRREEDDDDLRRDDQHELAIDNQLDDDLTANQRLIVALSRIVSAAKEAYKVAFPFKIKYSVDIYDGPYVEDSMDFFESPAQFADRHRLDLSATKHELAKLNPSKTAQRYLGCVEELRLACTQACSDQDRLQLPFRADFESLLSKLRSLLAALQHLLLTIGGAAAAADGTSYGDGDHYSSSSGSISLIRSAASYMQGVTLCTFVDFQVVCIAVHVLCAVELTFAHFVETASKGKD